MEKRKEELLIVGLGNPEADYADTRHNLGFACVRELARRLDVKIDRKRWQSLVGRSESRGAWFVLPQTYMNLSGEAVAKPLPAPHPPSPPPSCAPAQLPPPPLPSPTRAAAAS